MVFRRLGAFDQENTRIWETYYRHKPLFDHLATSQAWLPVFRQLIIEVQDIEHWKRR